MITPRLRWRLLTPAEIEERDNNRCNAKRGRRGRVLCEQPADHPAGPFHIGRDRLGRWHQWPVRTAA